MLLVVGRNCRIPPDYFPENATVCFDGSAVRRQRQREFGNVDFFEVGRFGANGRSVGVAPDGILICWELLGPIAAYFQTVRT